MSYGMPSTSVNSFTTIEDHLAICRILYIMEEVTEELAARIIPTLHLLDTISWETITIYINSPGGCAISGLAIYDAMRQINSPVHVVCTGQASSMGAIILAGGDYREATPNARIMIHEAAMGTEGKTKDLQIEVEELKKVEEILIDILEVHTGQRKVKIRKDIKLNKYMSAQEALDYGLIDNIVERAK